MNDLHDNPRSAPVPGAETPPPPQAQTLLGAHIELTQLKQIEADLASLQNIPINEARYDLRVALRSVRNAIAEIQMHLARNP